MRFGRGGRVAAEPPTTVVAGATAAESPGAGAGARRRDVGRPPRLVSPRGTPASTDGLVDDATATPRTDDIVLSE